MARRRNRFNSTELNDITIGLIFAAGGVNSLLAALLLQVKDRDLLVLLIGGGILALLMACRWFFGNPFHSARPLSTMVDVVTVAAAVLAFNGLLIWRCWPLVFVVLAEGAGMIHFFRCSRPKRR